MVCKSSSSGGARTEKTFVGALPGHALSGTRRGCVRERCRLPGDQDKTVRATVRPTSGRCPWSALRRCSRIGAFPLPTWSTADADHRRPARDLARSRASLSPAAHCTFTLGCGPRLHHDGPRPLRFHRRGDAARHRSIRRYVVHSLNQTAFAVFTARFFHHMLWPPAPLGDRDDHSQPSQRPRLEQRLRSHPAPRHRLQFGAAVVTVHRLGPAASLGTARFKKDRQR